MITPYDSREALPAWDLFDNDMIRLSIMTAKDKYDEAKKDLKEFLDKYGNFYSPLQRDMDWYRENVTDKFLNTINDLYARGIDPLRSPEGRAAVRQAMNSVDVGTINAMKQSAQNATEFLKAQQLLQAKGLYNPLYAQYDAPDMSKFSTVGDGMWTRVSPTVIQDVASFGNPYFEGMKPNVHAESKNGISYSREAITAEDLQRIANDKFNELVSTPLGQLMYQYYRDQVGGDANPNADVQARELFNNAIAAGQSRRIYEKDNYEDNFFKHRQLELQRELNALQRDRLNWEKQKRRESESPVPDSELEGFSLFQRWFDKAQSNAWSLNGIHKDWTQMKNSYGQFGKEVDKVFSDFGKNHDSAHIKNVNDAIKAYQNKFSIPMDEESVAKVIGDPLSDNNRVARATQSAIDKLYSISDVVTNTAGFTRSHTTKATKELRDMINKYGASNVTLTPMGDGYGSLRKDGGHFEVMPRVRVTVVDDKGKVVFNRDAYYNMGLSTKKTSGGAYLSGYKETGGTTMKGSFIPRSNNLTGESWIQDPISFDIAPSNSEREFNMLPDYDNWAAYGPTDTRVSHSLNAQPNIKLSTY